MLECGRVGGNECRRAARARFSRSVVSGFLGELILIDDPLIVEAFQVGQFRRVGGLVPLGRQRLGRFEFDPEIFLIDTEQREMQFVGGRIGSSVQGRICFESRENLVHLEEVFGSGCVTRAGMMLHRE